MIGQDDADVDLDEEDERTDLSASPQDADLNRENGDDALDGAAPLQIEAADRADAPYGAGL